MSGTEARASLPLVCGPDCDGSGSVEVNELVVCLSIALDATPLDACEPCDLNDDDHVTVHDLLRGVQLALIGCQILAAGDCRTARECAVEPWCLAPGEFAGCGVCIPDDVSVAGFRRCEQDEDCLDFDSLRFCGELGPQNGTCAPCRGPVLVCLLGCASDADCGEGESCAPDARCVPQACAASDDCPVEFDCMSDEEGGDGECQRRACRDDTGCDGGYCVEGLYFTGGRCFAEPGTCTLPPP